MINCKGHALRGGLLFSAYAKQGFKMRGQGYICWLWSCFSGGVFAGRAYLLACRFTQPRPCCGKIQFHRG